MEQGRKDLYFNPMRDDRRIRNAIEKAQVQSEFVENVVQVNRVSKKTTGGNKVGFSVLVVVGNKKGKVGVGLGKAADVAAAIKKGISIAKKHFINVPIVNDTIPFKVRIKVGAAEVMLKPAPKGSGIIAGGAVRSVVSAAGIQNISSKVLGSDNKASNIYATMTALQHINSLQKKFESIKVNKN